MATFMCSDCGGSGVRMASRMSADVMGATKPGLSQISGVMPTDSQGVVSCPSCSGTGKMNVFYPQ